MNFVKEYIEKITGEKLTLITESNNNLVRSSDKYIYKCFDESKKANTLHISEIVASEEIDQNGIKGLTINLLKINGIGIKHIWSNLPESDQDDTIKKIIYILKQIHNFDKIYELENDRSNFERGGDIISKIPEIAKAPFFDQKYKDIIESFFQGYYKTKPFDESKKYGLIHNDIWIANILYDVSSKQPYIIDFESGMSGPCVYDFYKILCQYYYAIEEKDEVEIDFTKKLILGIKNIYPELVLGFDTIEYRSFIYYEFLIKSHGWQNKRYKHKENTKFLNQMLKYIKPIKSLGRKTKLEVDFGITINYLGK